MKIRSILMKWVLLSVAMSASMAGAGQDCVKFRVDCRFYRQQDRFCYVSARYSLDQAEIKDIDYGVGCDYETIYDDGGIATPQEQVSDGIRPRTSALPKLQIYPQGSLRRPGTYSARLELDSGRVDDGVCYVRTVTPNEDHYVPMTGEIYVAE